MLIPKVLCQQPCRQKLESPRYFQSLDTQKLSDKIICCFKSLFGKISYTGKGIEVQIF